MVEWFEVVGSKERITGSMVDENFGTSSSYVIKRGNVQTIVFGVDNDSIKRGKEFRASWSAAAVAGYAERMGGRLGEYGFGKPPKARVPRRRG